jgi:predicted amidohydrolase YtcJ
VASVQPLPAEQARLGRGRTPPALHDLAAAGVPLAFGSGVATASTASLDPWGAVRVASSSAWGSSALSARAAFAAATRGGRRAARQDREGALRPGAPATFAVWGHIGALVVRTPDARVAAWSTDPRAATPGLPDLTGDGPGPDCRLTVIGGVVAHDVVSSPPRDE